MSGFAMVERLVLYESCIGDECDLDCYSPNTVLNFLSDPSVGEKQMGDRQFFGLSLPSQGSPEFSKPVVGAIEVGHLTKHVYIKWRLLVQIVGSVIHRGYSQCEHGSD